jgi:hypothetical protein
MPRAVPVHRCAPGAALVEEDLPADPGPSCFFLTWPRRWV